MKQYLAFKKLAFSSRCGVIDNYSMSQDDSKMCSKRASSSASVESGTAKEQANRRKSIQVCSYHVFSISQTLTNSLTNCRRPESTSQCTLAPEATELGGMRDIICTPIDSGHGDFLDYLVVTVSAAWQRMKISFHGFRVPFRVIFLNLCNDTNTNLPRVILYLFDIKTALYESSFKCQNKHEFLWNLALLGKGCCCSADFSHLRRDFWESSSFLSPYN